MSRLRADNLTNRAALGAPTATNGLIISGVATATTFDGNLTGNVTGTASNTSGATGDFSIADKIVHTGDTDTAIRFPAVDTFTVETAASERMRIDSSGRVVIGDTSTSSQLRVIGNEIRFSNSSNASYYGTITHDAGTTGANIYDSVDATAVSHIFQTSGTERLRIGSSGQIGLGGANYGTSGQVFTSNGSGSAPTWQDGGGAWNLVATVNASNASSATFQGDLDSTYKQYVAVISEVVSNGALNSELRMNFMVGATDLTGSLYDTTASRTTVNSSTAFTINQNDAAFGRLSNSGMDTDNPNHFVSAVVWLSGGRTAQSHAARFESINPVTATQGTQLSGMVQYQDTTNRAVDGVKFFPSTDTFSGTFKLYGLS